jgi:hypothetical protein
LGSAPSALSTVFGWLTVWLLPVRMTRSNERVRPGRRVAKENSDLSIYFVTLGFEFDQASEPLFSAQLLHSRSHPLSAGAVDGTSGKLNAPQCSPGDAGSASPRGLSVRCC